MSIFDRVAEHYSRPLTVVQASSTVEDALREVVELGARRLVVEAAGRVVGLVEPLTLVDALAAGVDFTRARVSGLRLSPPITVEPDARVIEAVELMVERGVTALIVEKGGEPLGLFTSWDAVAAFEPGDLEEPLLAFGPPARRTVSPWALLSEAVKVMAARKATALVLSEGGVPSGLLSLRGVLSHLLSGGTLASHSMDVADPLKAVVPSDSTVSEAAEAMATSWNEAAAITAHGRLIGVITEEDILVMVVEARRR